MKRGMVNYIVGKVPNPNGSLFRDILMPNGSVVKVMDKVSFDHAMSAADRVLRWAIDENTRKS